MTSPLAALAKQFDEDAKRFEWVAKHYYDLFAYHASQRLTSFNFFVVSLSFFSNAYATLVSKGTSDKPYYLIAAILAAAAYLLVIAFGRLDKRNEQIIEINEVPLKRIQSVFDLKFGGGGWTTFQRSDEESLGWRTFGSLLPAIYVLAATLAGFGATYGFYLADYFSFCGSIALGVGLWPMSWYLIANWKSTQRKELELRGQILTSAFERLGKG